jgi:HK97 family phage portal protein
MIAWLQRITNRARVNETRAALSIDPYWANFAAERGIGAASPDAVLSNLAVAARCVALRSELLASVPLHLYRRTDADGRARATENPLYDILHGQPNPQQSGFEYREQLVRSLDLLGNSYSRIEWNARGQVTALWPILYSDCQPELLPNGRLRYKVFNGRRSELLLQEEVLHVRGPSRNGVLGLSPISIARGALGLAMTQANTATSMSESSFRPSAIVSYPGVLTKEQREFLKDRLPAEYAGAKNAGKLVIADAGAKYEKISFSPEDSQFLEQRRLSNEDVCRVFGLPPTSVGITDKATYSNVEQESFALVRNSLAPLASRIENAMQRCLLTDVGRRSLYVEHDLAGLLRGDVVARYSAYRVARECGVLSANDCRRLENQPPVGPEGDLYHMPSNWTVLGPGIAPSPP